MASVLEVRDEVWTVPDRLLAEPPANGDRPSARGRSWRQRDRRRARDRDRMVGGRHTVADSLWSAATPNAPVGRA
jgi:hypothetical protein